MKVLIWEDHYGSSRVYDATYVDLAYLALFRDMDAEDYWSSSGIDQPMAKEEDSLLGRGDDREMQTLKKLYAQAKIGLAKSARLLCEHASSWESQHSELVDVTPTEDPIAYTKRMLAEGDR